jgi:large subunit ribosomal protein L29
MASKSWKEFKDMSDDMLRDRAAELQRNLFKFRFQRTLGQLEKPHMVNQARRDYARIQTLLRQREVRKGGS